MPERITWMILAKVSATGASGNSAANAWSDFGSAIGATPRPDHRNPRVCAQATRSTTGTVRNQTTNLGSVRLTRSTSSSAVDAGFSACCALSASAGGVRGPVRPTRKQATVRCEASGAKYTQSSTSLFTAAAFPLPTPACVPETATLPNPDKVDLGASSGPHRPTARLCPIGDARAH